MKIAYLVLAHNNPKHLLRLIKSLSSNSSSFFIHIDSKSNLSEFAGIDGGSINFLQDRIPVYWGDFSQVEAILCLIRTALSRPEIYDYFVLLSGVDYPLKSVAYIENFLKKTAEKNSSTLFRCPVLRWESQFLA